MAPGAHDGDGGMFHERKRNARHKGVKGGRADPGTSCELVRVDGVAYGDGGRLGR